MKILWCGPFYSDTALFGKLAVNHAASKWSRGLLRALIDIGCELRTISHCAEQRWPKGSVFWQDSDHRLFLDWFPCAGVSYCNAVGIKGLWLRSAYRMAAKRMFSQWTPDVVVCYNSLHQENVAVMNEAKKHGIPSVPIILDGDDPRKDSWRRVLRDNRFASGVVFLSHWAYTHYPKQELPLLHLDGGVDAFKGLPPVRKKSTEYTIAHIGSLDNWRGLNLMKSIVRSCKRDDVRFVFCGKCDKAKLWHEFGNDRRVEILGSLPDSRIDEICHSADMFLNVRDPSVGDNILNFPSKVPNYLAWGKPVVSTWIDSFSPDYRDVLVVADNSSPDSFVSLIDEVLAWSHEKRLRYFEEVKSWYNNKNQWSIQAKRLVDFLGTIR